MIGSEQIHGPRFLKDMLLRKFEKKAPTPSLLKLIIRFTIMMVLGVFQIFKESQNLYCQTLTI